MGQHKHGPWAPTDHGGCLIGLHGTGDLLSPSAPAVPQGPKMEPDQSIGQSLFSLQPPIFHMLLIIAHRTEHTLLLLTPSGLTRFDPCYATYAMLCYGHLHTCQGCLIIPPC